MATRLLSFWQCRNGMEANRIMAETIFFDANASVPVLDIAREAFVDALAQPGNPSSPHLLGRKARQRLDQARARVADALGGLEKDIMFTSGASEGNRWLVDALVEKGKIVGRRLCVGMSPLEHPAFRKPLLAAHRAEELDVVEGKMSDGGAIIFPAGRLEKLDALIVTAAHNETGILPRLQELLEGVRAECIVISDAAQATGRMAPLPERVDAIVASAHKMGGLAGAGAVLLRGHARGLPLPWSGGGQEGGRRPGTEPLALLCAFGAVAEIATQIREQHAALAPLRDRLEDELLACWSGAEIVGASCPRLPQTSAVYLRGADGEALRMAIDRAGICVGFGSACSALAPEPSPALLALGLSPAAARATVRFSMAPGASPEMVNEAVARLGNLRRFLCPGA